MITYLWIANCFITLIGIVWSSKTWLNIFLKCLVFALAIWGWYIIFRVSGGIITIKIT